MEKIESKKEDVRRNICGGKLASPSDVNEDAFMVAIGKRQPLITRNPRVFESTPYEKDFVRKHKKLKVPRGSAYIYQPNERLKGRLIIYYENKLKDPTFKTTESVRCFNSEVLGILAERRDRKLSIKKYYFNY